MSANTVTLAGKTVEVDEEGFLKNRSEWTEEMAREMAKRDNCELTPDHWEVIKFVREYVGVHQYTPSNKEIGKKLGPEKGKPKYLYELFPYGPRKQACKYAGLPKPTGCT